MVPASSNFFPLNSANPVDSFTRLPASDQSKHKYVRLKNHGSLAMHNFVPTERGSLELSQIQKLISKEFKDAEISLKEVMESNKAC